MTLSRDFARFARPLPEAHLLVGADGTVHAWNPAAASLFRLEPGSEGGVHLSQLVADSRERVDDYIGSCAQSGSFLPGSFVLGSNGRDQHLRCDGARMGGPGVHVVLRFRPHSDATGQFLALNTRIGELNREITRRSQAEAQLREQSAEMEDLAAELEQSLEALRTQHEEAQRARTEAEQANRAKSEFLAVMSHELRTPLNVILGYVDLLDAGVHGELNEPQLTQTDRIRTSARHLITLIEEILAFSRVESGAESLRLTEIDPALLAGHIAELTAPIITQRGLAFERDFADAPAALRTDATKAGQILLNLLSNAAKFTERGHVRFRVAQRGPDAVFEVHDTGPGIASPDLERIFEPFTQLDGSRTRRAGGAGLGLAVSRSLARMLGGDLEVDSTDGQGSTFRLRLPVAGPREE